MLTFLNLPSRNRKPLLMHEGFQALFDFFLTFFFFYCWICVSLTEAVSCCLYLHVAHSPAEGGGGGGVLC